MNIDKKVRKKLLKRYPKDVINKATKEASNEAELNELLEIYLDAYYKKITREPKDNMLNVTRNSSGMCHM